MAEKLLIYMRLLDVFTCPYCGARERIYLKRADLSRFYCRNCDLGFTTAQVPEGVAAAFQAGLDFITGEDECSPS